MTSLMWFRRDLRLRDHPALMAASDAGPVVALFVLDDVLLRPAGAPRLAHLYGALRALDADLRAHGGELVVRHGDPVDVVPALARQAGADQVHVSADFGPYGARRDGAVAAALGDVAFVATGSPYAVAPGRAVKSSDGSPFKVFTPFFRAWQAHGWRKPAPSDPATVSWVTGLGSEPIPADPPLPAGLTLQQAGEAAALATWTRFRSKYLASYAADRDRPDLDTTSHISVHLKFGTIHPRTLLADLDRADQVFRKELAWREFYAAVLAAWPSSAREYFVSSMAAMKYDTGPTAQERFAAWTAGRTGYPIVDAGMRQLLAEGWMHNRLRMITASFLVKDLHLEWTAGARHFMRHLVDADLASNSHGWQWTAGTGTDASPYFRIFNPVTQGKKFDPAGDYIRRYVPELSGVDSGCIHEPWLMPANVRPADYPAPIVDHSAERLESLQRYQALRR